MQIVGFPMLKYTFDLHQDFVYAARPSWQSKTQNVDAPDQTISCVVCSFALFVCLITLWYNVPANNF